MLPTLHISADHVQGGEYIGPDVSDYEGHIEIAADLGRVRFAGSISVKGRIRALAGEGIEAGLVIKSKRLSANPRIFAGLVNWRKIAPGEDHISAEILSGTVALGTVVTPEVAS